MKAETVVTFLVGAVVGAAVCYATYGKKASAAGPTRVTDDPADLGGRAPGVPPFVPGVLPEGTPVPQSPQPTPSGPAIPPGILPPGLAVPPIPPGLPALPFLTA